MAAPTPARVRPAAIPVPPAIDRSKSVLNLNIFNGARQPFQLTSPVLVTITDGQQNELFRDSIQQPDVSFSLPIHDNLADNYCVIAFAEGFEQAGFQPAKMTSGAAQTLDLMLLPKNGSFNFAQAKWTGLVTKKPRLAELSKASVGNGVDTATVYGQIEECHSDQLACLLNITTAMEQIALPQGNPLSYFKQLDLPALAPDRFFGYADAKLVDQVKLAVQHKTFVQQSAADLLLHPGATSSFKQIQFGEANVQLTFHEDKRLTIGGVDCVYVEPDIDYFKDPLAHAVLEVIPNGLTGNVSNPRVVYVLRWIAGQHAGVPEFDPLYTIQ